MSEVGYMAHRRKMLHTPARGAKSVANDLDRGAAITRAVFSLRFFENKPRSLSIRPLGVRA